jgi:membrane protease YdiL (CAAX protease family)
VAPDEPRFTVWQAVVGYVVAFAVSLIGVTIILAATGYTNTKQSDWPIWLLAVSQLPLWIGLVGVTIVVSRTFGTGRLRRDYGLRIAFGDVIGLGIGVVLQLVFVKALYRLIGVFVKVSEDKISQPAREIAHTATGRVGVVLLVLVVVVGAPIVEELFFRGLVLRSIQARYSDGLALVVSAVLFAAVHFQAWQFPALVMVGLVLGYCAQRTGRLGLSIFVHMGFNATAVIDLLVRNKR